jgi:hypothetical protein
MTVHVLRITKRAVKALRLNDGNNLLLQTSGSRSWKAVALKSSFVHPKLVLLRVRPDGERLSATVMITADAVDANAFRRLRAALLAPL